MEPDFSSWFESAARAGGGILLLAREIDEHVHFDGDVHDAEDEADPYRHEKRPKSWVRMHVATSPRSRRQRAIMRCFQ
jgi:hypothetical protein